VVWGLYHGTIVVITHILGQRVRVPERLRPATDILGTGLTFTLVLIGWVFFRSPDLTAATHYLREMFYLAATGPFTAGIAGYRLPLASLGVAALAHAVTYALRYDVDERSVLLRLPYPARLVTVSAAATFTILFGGEATSFIYFQF